MKYTLRILMESSRKIIFRNERATPQSRKPRSRFACNQCHSRKVRCDVSLRGAPCTNCTLDCVPCHTKLNRKSTRKVVNGELSNHKPVGHFTRLNAQLPAYIHPLPLHLGEDEMQYIKCKGVFDIPSIAIRRKLWQAYFRQVHPAVPILNVKETLEALQQESGAPKISLLLFYCIMCAAQLFLLARGERLMQPAMLQVMFGKARALYDIGWEKNPTTIFQCLILMTYLPNSSDETKGPRHWLCQAVSLGYELELHRDPEQLSFDSCQRSFRKLLWWSVYLRERMLALDTTGPWIIKDMDYEVPTLSLSDFDLLSWSEGNDGQKLRNMLGDITYPRELAEIFVAKTKLAIILGQLVPISMSCQDSNTEAYEHRGPQAECAPPGAAELEHIEDELDNWLASLPSELICSQSGQPPTQKDNFQLHLHILMLHLFHHIVCFHAAVLRRIGTKESFAELPDQMNSSFRIALRPILRVAKELVAYKLAGFIPILGLSVLRPFLLCAFLQGRKQHNVLESQILSLLPELNEIDPYAKPTSSNFQLHLGTQNSYMPSTAPRHEINNMTASGSNIFDAMFYDVACHLDMPISFSATDWPSCTSELGSWDVTP